MSLGLCAVNHISRVVQDVDASTAFYRDVLGFTVVKRPSSFDFGGSWLFSYNVGIHLIEGQPVPRSSEIDPKSDHLSFQAENLEEVQRRLQDMGIPFVKQTIFEAGMEVQQVFFHDPDQNMIEVCDCHCLPILPVDSPSCSLPRCSSCTALAKQLQGLASSEDEGEVSGDGLAAAANNHCGSLSGDEEASGFDPAALSPLPRP